MYSKTNPGTGRLSARRKRVFAIAGVLVVLGLGGLGLWGALGSDSYSGSGHGCVNVTVPNSTGGVVLPDVVPLPGPDLAAGPAAMRAGRAGALGQPFGGRLGRHRSGRLGTWHYRSHSRLHA